MQLNFTKSRQATKPRPAIYLIPSNAIVLIFLMLPTVSIVPQVRSTEASMHLKASPCCSFPCRNGGACMDICQCYRCDCTGTNHYGKNCQNENWSYKLKRFIRASATMLGLSDVMDMTLVQYEPKFSEYHGGFCNENFNGCREPMLISPVPEYCPTPLGIAGFQMLPPVETLFDLILKRRCPTHQQHTSSNTNLLFVVFAQFLANQMWKCSNSNWLGSSAMYGNFVRTGIRGKVTKYHNEQHGNIYQNVLTDTFQGIILQEHNRLCNILSQENPKWNDQRLFDTATLIVTGEILTITAKEWLPLLHDFGGVSIISNPFIVLNKVPKETKLAFFWPQMFPDSVWVEGARIDLSMLLNTINTDLPKGGHYHLMKIAATTAPARMGPLNIPGGLEEPTKFMIMEGRLWKFQSYNNYREYLGLGRLSSLTKLTKNHVVLKHLESMYGDIDGLEMIPGLLLETPRLGHLLGDTTLALISNTIHKAVVTHPLNSVPLKKKFTFGGKTGWNIVQNAKIQTLVCNNVCDKKLCEKEGLIHFKSKITPQGTLQFVKPVKVGNSKKTCHKNAVRTGRATTQKKCRMTAPTKPACTKATENSRGPATLGPKNLRTCPLAQSKTPCVPKSQPAEAKIDNVCRITAKAKPPACQDEAMACTAKKCCIKRPWYRIFTTKSKPTKLAATNPPCELTTDCVQKKLETCPRLDPKMESPCEPKRAARPAKCCVKRAWYRSWLRG